MINQEHTQQLVGRDLLDRDGHRIGQITQVYVDDRTGGAGLGHREVGLVRPE